MEVRKGKQVGPERGSWAVIASQPDGMGNVKQEQSFKVVLYYDKPGGFMFLSRLIIEFRLPPKGGMTLVRVFSNREQFPESDGS